MIKTRRKIAWGLALVSAVGLGACGPNLAFLADRSQTEAQSLQGYCLRGNLRGDEITQADSLLNRSKSLSQDGKSEQSRLASEQALGLYRMALAKAEKAKADSSLVATDSALANDKTRLAAYREILDEMKSMGKP